MQSFLQSRISLLLLNLLDSDRKTLERLYLVVVLAFLFGTTHGITVQSKGLRNQIDPYWERGLSYLTNCRSAYYLQHNQISLLFFY